jgi:aerobic-type carbon monoxide dehydrogenase small subunit (CoxS/CutS family)
MRIEFILNHEKVSLDVDGRQKLVHVLRDVMGQTGTKIGCEIGQCGSCTVILNGKLVKSCLIPMKAIVGKNLLTIEGVAGNDGEPNDLQLSFLEYGAIQCGYCTPGMVLAGQVLLSSNPNPSRREIREAISANLCRCTGYQQIVDAIEATSQKRILARRGQVGETL